MKVEQLVERLVEHARLQIGAQSVSGAMPSGRNGAYGQPETPARCTSHALTSFCHAYAATGDIIFKTAAERALAYLLTIFRESPGSIIMRHAPGRDHSNGVLGQAFVIEAFRTAGKYLCSEEAIAAGLALIERHDFNAEFHLWNRILPLGQSARPDMTFNHQLYYAAVVAMFIDLNPELRGQVERFAEGWQHTLLTREDGRIVHEVHVPVSRRPLLVELKSKVKAKLRRSNDDAARAKEADYHLYNMYAFALLAKNGIDAPAFAGPEKWGAITSYSTSGDVQRLLDRKNWSLPLRSGTETRVLDASYANTVFANVTPDYSDVVAYLDRTLGHDGQADVLSPDPVTQRARTYRYWRLAEAGGWTA